MAVGLGLVVLARAPEPMISLWNWPRIHPANWVMTGRDYNAQNYSQMTDTNKENVKLRPAWSFSTGVLHGHEGTPLVVGGKMFVHAPFPNTTSALDLNERGKILWMNKPKQNPKPAGSWRTGTSRSARP